MCYEDLGEALSAEFNAKVTDAGDEREAVKKSSRVPGKRGNTAAEGVG
jgi:hypothetical protein